MSKVFSLNVFSLVALNYQTKSEEMDINSGKFRPNGNCGYVLKPSFQRLPLDSSLESVQSQQLRIYLVSGENKLFIINLKRLVVGYLQPTNLSRHNLI